jgi:predicted aspartyl protease
MSNKLTSSKYPFLPLSIHVRVSNRKNIDINTEALIDTGFSGDIVVPADDVTVMVGAWPRSFGEDQIHVALPQMKPSHIAEELR